MTGPDLGPSSTSTVPQSSSIGSFLFSPMGAQPPTPAANPNLGQMRHLWKFYVQNVDPLVRIVHKPSIERILDSLQSRNGGVEPGTQTLLLAICYSAVSSLPPSQARVELACDTDSLIRSFRSAVEKSLHEVQLVRTHDLLVLQAFVLYLSCVPRSEACSIGIMIALAVRIARAMGLHRDGSLFKLSPFETEMRRRLWWYLCLLDFRVSEDAGLEANIVPSSFDTKMPLNINDQHMDATSTELCGRPGYTEMMFHLIRCEAWPLAASWSNRSIHCQVQEPVRLKERQDTLDKLFVHLDDTYLRYCRQMSTPMSRLLIQMTPLIISKLRLVASYPSYHGSAQEPSQLTTDEKNALFQSTIHLLDFEQILRGEDELKGWHWFFSTAHIQWHAMAFALSELCVRVEGDTETTAWDVIEKIFPSAPFGLSNDKTESNIWSPLLGLKQKALCTRYCLQDPGSMEAPQVSEFFPFESGDLHDILVDWTTP